jgi:hypothetical protein
VKTADDACFGDDTVVHANGLADGSPGVVDGVGVGECRCFQVHVCWLRSSGCAGWQYLLGDRTYDL